MELIYSKSPRRDLKEEKSFYEEKIEIDNHFFSYGFIGPFSYCWKVHILFSEDMMSEKKFDMVLQIGNCCNIAEGNKIVFEKKFKTDFNINHPIFKACVLIQNDVWLGDSCTIMNGVIIRNGAVVARNSYVDSNVPPYAIVGGNPAKIIGYRFPEDIITKLQVIQWWNWDKNKLIQNITYFNENVEYFCNLFYPDAKRKLDELNESREMNEGVYFAFVDFYDANSCYGSILHTFLNIYKKDEDKKLIFFVRDDLEADRIDETVTTVLKKTELQVIESESIKCTFEVVIGDREKAKKVFADSQYYILSRTYDTVFFSCLADLLGIEIVSM